MECKPAKAHAGSVYGLDRPCPIKIAEFVLASPEISNRRTGIDHDLGSVFPGHLGSRG